jgi:transposase
MSINDIDIKACIADVKSLLAADTTMSAGLRASITMLILVVELLTQRFGLNSRNSSKPPSTDTPGLIKNRRVATGKKPGGQIGHDATHLTPVANPDQIQNILLDTQSLPAGQYHDAGYEARQEIQVRLKKYVIEYRAQILENAKGKRFVAAFPPSVIRKVQYGASVKAHAVYLSVFQMLPFDRIVQQFASQYGIHLSAGSLVNFNQNAFERLTVFGQIAKQQLIKSGLLHADETGANIDGKSAWLHNLSNQSWTLITPHASRGAKAMEDIGVLPNYFGHLVHDHWKAYFRYLCLHVLCNAHHLRELTHADEQGFTWAKKMLDFLVMLNNAVDAAGGALDPLVAANYRLEYRQIIADAEVECPAPPEPAVKKRGRAKRSKARNLLERLRDFENETLRFMDVLEVPFTNNQGERDIRMFKVHEKISGCFRSMQGAEVFCLIRSYISTCQKQGVEIAVALDLLFNGQWPDFIQIIIDDNSVDSPAAE